MSSVLNILPIGTRIQIIGLDSVETRLTKESTSIELSVMGIPEIIGLLDR